MERITGLIDAPLTPFSAGTEVDLGPNRTPFRNLSDEEEKAMLGELEAIGFFGRRYLL